MLVVILLVGFAVLYGTMVLTLRTEAWNRAIVSSDNLLRSLDGNLARSLGEYLDTFEILATELGTAEHNKLAGGHESVAVRAHGALIKSTGDLFLFDETGTIQERSITSWHVKPSSTGTSWTSTDAIRHWRFASEHPSGIASAVIRSFGSAAD